MIYLNMSCLRKYTMISAVYYNCFFSPLTYTKHLFCVIAYATIKGLPPPQNKSCGVICPRRNMCLPRCNLPSFLLSFFSVLFRYAFRAFKNRLVSLFAIFQKLCRGAKHKNTIAHRNEIVNTALRFTLRGLCSGTINP